MATRRERSPSVMSACDASLESSYRSWKAQRPQLFRQHSQQHRIANAPMVRTTYSPQVDALAPNNSHHQADNTRAPVHIAVIADDHDHMVDLPLTLYDPSLTRSLISKSKAFATQGRISPCSPLSLLITLNPASAAGTADTSRTNRARASHREGFAARVPLTTSTTLTLRWRYAHGLQSFHEVFYVIDAASIHGFDAVLRGTINVTPADQAATLPLAHPLIFVSSLGRSSGSGSKKTDRDRRDDEKKSRKEREYRAQVESQRREVRKALEGKGSKRS
ncbi:uncharacterized protein HMPREF1541_03168 [Cyphellophora europaea CBS 101466]|uniref:Uncharacterized protein n=1 Tax=Cyphellophora europaea (strain CBS 101466) TaxID=1220924 RepID=W2RZL2_CYPE1|nr:uncharacterized protein HMPREF1541_03168 [Cyphellophora europaea CBS 101466]ETN41233.1 hypothetical protein HMPREF1541_03168 [Cyphellophora europaea CBS 101466]